MKIHPNHLKKIVLVLLVVFSTASTKAQDIHFSQFYASPLTLNPALTGINDCNYRASINYRNQWHSITVPTTFTTFAAAFDINSLAARNIKTGNLSAGLVIFSDKAGDGDLSNTSVLASAGYRYSFDEAKKYSLSVGLQTGYVHKGFNIELLDFEDEFNGTNFTGIATNENFPKTGLGYLDMNAGLLFVGNVSPKINVYAGAAAFHLIQPKESFLNNANSKLNMRTVAHAGAKVKFNEKWSIVPSVLYMGQSKATEINFGTNLGYHISNANMESDIYFGGYYRLGDAVNLMVGGEFNSVRLGLSYDINISGLSSATNNKGGFELSLSYTGCIGGLILEPPVLWCPRF